MKKREPKRKCVLCQALLGPSDIEGFYLHPDTGDKCRVVITDHLGISVDDTYEYADGQVWSREAPAIDTNTPIEFGGTLFTFDGKVYGATGATEDGTTFLSADAASKRMFEAIGQPYLGGPSGPRGWSSVKAYQRCPYLWKAEYAGGRTVTGDAPGPKALEIGSLVHIFLAIYYSQLLNPLYPIDPESARRFLQLAPVTPEFLEEAWQLFEGYKIWWGDESSWMKVLAVEELVVDPRTGFSCRWDAVFEVMQPHEGMLPGVFVVNHKCLRGDARIWDYTTNKLWTVQDLFKYGVAPTLLAVDPVNGGLALAQAGVPEADTVRPVFDVTTEPGRRLAASDNHPFLTARGWVQAQDLTTDDWVAVPWSTAVGEFPCHVTAAEARFVGFMIAEGGLSGSSSISFTQNPGPTFDAFMATLRELDVPETEYTVINDKRSTLTVRLSSSRDSHLRQFLARCGMLGQLSAEKFIPTEFMSLPDSLTGVLIGALWDGDGCVGVNTRHGYPTAIYSTIAPRLAADVQSLLLRLGVPSTITELTQTVNGAPYCYFAVTVVTRRGKRTFLEAVGGLIPSSRLVDSAKEALAALSDNDDDDELVPFALIATSLSAMHPKPHRVSQWLSHFKNTAGLSVEKRSLTKHCPDLKIDNSIQWERVASVISNPPERLYNLTVPGFENFVANDIVTHNTSATNSQITREQWKNDGQILGEIDLYERLGYHRRWGTLRGSMINLIIKTKAPQYTRSFVYPHKAILRDHRKSLGVWSAQMELAAATGNYPRARAACITQYHGFCELFEHCAGADEAREIEA